MSNTDRFMALFKGLPSAFGVYSNKRAKTVRKPIERHHYENHLSGKVGVGVVPIDGDMCRFGAIDIDDVKVDHQCLVDRIKENKWPLIVCRSKSGGAHIYTFSDKPVKAADLRRALSFVAAQVGYGGCEIFPKQDAVKPGDVGNWINLPYFDIADTNRYAIGENGPALFEEFLQQAEALQKGDGLETFIEEIEPEGMPPCLSYLYRDGIHHGNRNEVLYSFAVFLKKSGAPDIEEELMKINHRVTDQPLPVKEIKNIAASVKRKDYQYKCKDPNLKLHCDVVACKKLKFGVGNSHHEDYDDHIIGCLTKHLTDPPRWVLDINGVDVEFSTDDLMNYYRVRVLSMEKANVIAPPIKQEEWLLMLKERLDNVRIEEAPDDASQHGDLMSAMEDFIQVSDRAMNGRMDLLRGIPVRDKYKDEPVVFFRSQDFLSHLKRRKSPISLSGNNLWMALRKIGCYHQKIKVGTKPIQAWYVIYDEKTMIPVLEPMSDYIEI